MSRVNPVMLCEDIRTLSKCHNSHNLAVLTVIALYLNHVSPAGWAGRGCRSCADRCAEVMTQLVSPDQRWTQEVELVTSAGISHDTSYTQL